MENKDIFERYIEIARALGALFPPVLEVAILDFKDLDHPLIFIVNGQITGREVGGSANELNCRLAVEENALPNNATAMRGSHGQSLKSRLLPIHDDQGKIIGAFCLHFDTAPFEQFQKFLDFFVNAKAPSHPAMEGGEEIPQKIEAWLLKKGLFAQALSYKDKQHLVAYLFADGSFKKRGAISSVASALQLTRQCIYNYLEIAKRENDTIYRS